jgi:hypothetical protein
MECNIPIQSFSEHALLIRFSHRSSSFTANELHSKLIEVQVIFQLLAMERIIKDQVSGKFRVSDIRR